MARSSRASHRITVRSPSWVSSSSRCSGGWAAGSRATCCSTRSRPRSPTPGTSSCAPWRPRSTSGSRSPWTNAACRGCSTSWPPSRLRWYVAVDVSKALDADLPMLACILIGVVGRSAGRFFIDVTRGVTPQLRAWRVVRGHGRADQRGVPPRGRRSDHLARDPRRVRGRLLVPLPRSSVPMGGAVAPTARRRGRPVLLMTSRPRIGGRSTCLRGGRATPRSRPTPSADRTHQRGDRHPERSIHP